MIERTAFLKSGVIVELSMCDQSFADHWCEIHGYDQWLIVNGKSEEPEPIRSLVPGDSVSLKSGAESKSNRELQHSMIDKVQKAAKTEAAAVEGG